jgi:hypothetical protein
VRRIFWPEAGILVRCRFLGAANFIRDFWKPGRYKENTGVSPRFARTVLDIAPEGGSDKNSKGTFPWKPKRIEPIGRV